MWRNKALFYAICSVIGVVMLWVSAEERSIKIKGTLAILVEAAGAALSYLADGSGVLDLVGTALFVIGMLGFSWIQRKMKTSDEEDET